MKNTEANRVWLTAGPALELRKLYEKKATLEVDALMSAAMESPDPKVRMHATAFATWKTALKELETKGDDDSD